MNLSVPLRRTKIVATLGPASEDPAVLARMIAAGMDVARFNLSHGTAADHRARMEALRAAVAMYRESVAAPGSGHTADPALGHIAPGAARRVGVLFDLRGPEIRLGTFPSGKVDLADGQTFTITTAPGPGSSERASVELPLFPDLVHPGDNVLLDDGNLALEVLEIREAAGPTAPAPGGTGAAPVAPAREVVCRVRVGGTLADRKKINIPGRHFDVPYLSPKDEADLEMAVALEVDFVAASFVRRAGDVDLVRRFLRSRGGQQMIVAKIECQEALADLDAIIGAADALMVARGDLGVEVPAEDVPIIQKDLIARSVAAGKPVITATQMLESMVDHPRPTRAEASDVANAIFDGTDAVMLSAETTTGRYPVEAVATMARVASRAERALGSGVAARIATGPSAPNVTGAVSLATVTIAAQLGAGAIVTSTTTGYTARMVARHRPSTPIVAVTTSEAVARQQTLTWGVYPVRAGEAAGTDEMFLRATVAARQSGVVDPGSIIVITAGAPPGTSGSTNLIKVHTLGRVLVRGAGLLPASATGVVRVCRSAEEARSKVAEGDILAVAGLGPEWFEVMRRAVAWIVEEGGEASFGAVQARALGRVAVIDATGALRTLTDGELVTLDGARGLVYEGRATVL